MIFIYLFIYLLLTLIQVVEGSDQQIYDPCMDQNKKLAQVSIIQQVTKTLLGEVHVSGCSGVDTNREESSF